ncbi:hypothetical protein ENC19_00495 [Verrucosispora sp. CWR15]|uniref:Uncharacterized protein n=1 Tax=Verrucosispora sioxanthis TaxID=2499994 RepID=A0A6M1L6S0_9ACTN|nr:hypothetical protein [Verrucosispora sioxanthis]NEE62153.1 hypothetical protein [Verrucosispora sioxanthis]NGM11263.1 hypothetical protein [Verrucosispora sioxanthis]
MKSSDRPDEGPDARRGKGRRWGRGRSEAAPEESAGGEDFGWIDDLRSAKQQRTELGPDGVAVEPPAAARRGPERPGQEPPVRPAPAPVNHPGPDGPVPPPPGRGPAEPPRARPVDGPWPGNPPARPPAGPPPVGRNDPGPPAVRPTAAGHHPSRGRCRQHPAGRLATAAWRRRTSHPAATSR